MIRSVSPSKHPGQYLVGSIFCMEHRDGCESAASLPRMAIGDCATCRELIDAARVSISRHLAATSRFTLAMKKNASDEELSALENEAQACSLARENAVTRYDQHRAQHETGKTDTGKTMAAGSGQNDS